MFERTGWRVEEIKGVAAVKDTTMTKADITTVATNLNV